MYRITTKRNAMLDKLEHQMGMKIRPGAYALYDTSIWMWLTILYKLVMVAK